MILVDFLNPYLICTSHEIQSLTVVYCIKFVVFVEICVILCVCVCVCVCVCLK